MHGRLVALAAVAALFGTACIGSVDRHTLVDEVRARGGGVSRGELSSALDVVSAAANGGMTLVRSIDVEPLYDRVTVTVQDPNDPGVVDNYRVEAGELLDVTPVRVTAGTSSRSFLARDVPVDRVEVMADRSLIEFGGEAWVDRYRFQLDPSRTTGLHVFFIVSSLRSGGLVMVDVDADAYTVERG